MKLNQHSILLAIYGEGGHRAEMISLIKQLREGSGAFELLSFGNGQLPFEVIEHIPAADIRSKHSRLRNYCLTLPVMLSQFWSVIRLMRRYKVVGVISTGPGLAVIPILICRIVGIKTIFVETYCRFNTRSLTGRLMYRLAHRFLVQNKSLKRIYPNSEYCGRL